MRSLLAVAAIGALASACAASASPERTEEAQFRPRAVVGGLEQPTHVTAAPGEPGRLYVVEQAGVIRIVERGRLRPQPFLDIRSRVRSGGEQGLLSVAFHPRYASTRRFYVNYTDRNGHTNVVEYRSSGARALPASARRLLLVRQPYANHNGGQIAFGPNGRLYVGMGDGGSGGDPENRAQNMSSLLGKLLSINVATRGVRIEGLGLRNPWRFSFDRATGDLYIGDVGQSALEEVDYTPARSPGLENYGWDVYEARARFEDKEPGPGRLVFPVAQYSLAGEKCAITGGFVYRGSRAPLRGRYLYGDYCGGQVWSLVIAGGKATRVRREPFTIAGLSSFGEDTAGELFAVSQQNGTLYRLTP